MSRYRGFFNKIEEIALLLWVLIVLLSLLLGWGRGGGGRGFDYDPNENWQADIWMYNEPEERKSDAKKRGEP